MTLIDEIDKLTASAKLIIRDDISGFQIISPVVTKLLKLTSNVNSSIDELSLIMETEPSLSISVLRLANSSFYNLSHKITSIKHAVILLGFSSIRQFAISQLIYKTTIKPENRQAFKPLFYWQHSLFVATLSKIIAKKINHPEPDLLYAAGLLHDIGKLILENHGRLRYSDFLHSFEKSDNPSLENEHIFFGINHAELGAVLCHQYQLPESITNIILYHHCFESLNVDIQQQQNIAIITYANFIAWLQKTGSVERSNYPILAVEVLNIISAFNLDIGSILSQVDEEMNNISKFYNIKFPNVNKIRSNLVETFSHSSLLTNTREIIATPVALNTTTNRYINSLMVPHHSLDPDILIPHTLEAISQYYNFDRLILLNINPKHRSLIASYCWPDNIILKNDKRFEILISSLSGGLLSSLRKKQPMLITDANTADKHILQKLQVDSFFSLPILSYNRLIYVLYIDNAISGKELDVKMLPHLDNITTELGIALFNARQYSLEKKKAQLDPLTKLNNRGMINSYLKNIFDGSKAQLNRLAIGFIDIDYFKNFNDIYGHKAGDDVLNIVADIMRSLTRPGDFIGRYGGEEFLFVLSDTDETSVRAFAERLRFEVEKKGKMLRNRFAKQSLTVSIGIALYHSTYNSYLKMIDAADQAMYQSKENGRNKVMLTNDILSSELISFANL